jgi:hypothetical protein
VSVPTRVTPAVALACLLVLGATAPALAFTPAPTGTGTTEPRILAAYPNPVTDGDAGEFVVRDARNLTLSDGEGSVRVPVDGTVALSATPERTRNLTDHRVVGVDLPGLANGGEVLTLTRDDERLVRVAYEAEVRRWWDADGGSGWEPLGRTDRPVVETT